MCAYKKQNQNRDLEASRTPLPVLLRDAQLLPSESGSQREEQCKAQPPQNEPNQEMKLQQREMGSLREQRRLSERQSDEGIKPGAPAELMESAMQRTRAIEITRQPARRKFFVRTQGYKSCRRTPVEWNSIMGWVVIQRRRERRETELLHGGGPHLTAHPLLIRIVVIWLSAVGASDIVVLVVHAVLRVVLRLWVNVAVVCSTRGRNGLL